MVVELNGQVKRKRRNKLHQSVRLTPCFALLSKHTCLGQHCIGCMFESRMCSHSQNAAELYTAPSWHTEHWQPGV